MKNRELKFRAWDAKNKKFVVTGFDILGETTAFDLLKQYKLEEWCELEITQFTGLFDSLGREIYEGDVIFADESNWEVIFDMGGFHIRWKEGDKLTPLYQYPDCLVVGNVFETPGLLNAKR